MRRPTQDTWELLRLPLGPDLTGAVATIGAVVRNRLSCRGGGATIGAGMLGLLELGMLAGGCL